MISTCGLTYLFLFPSSFNPIPLLPQYALQFISVSVIAGLLLYYTYGQVANLKEEKLIKQRYVHKGEREGRVGGWNGGCCLREQMFDALDI
jgi:hypothetical protein